MGKGGVSGRWLILPVLAALLAGCGPRAGGAGGGRAQVLVGIGASDAVGIGAADPQHDNWVARLGAHLPADARTINLGINGATAAQAVQQELPVALDAGPTLVAVWLGVNDVMQQVPLAQFSQQLDAILAALHTQTAARTYVANLPELEKLPAFGSVAASSLAETTAQWNAAIARVAGQNGAVLVDVHAAWSALPESAGLISSDGLHPTSAGYQRLADLFWQAIRSAG